MQAEDYLGHEVACGFVLRARPAAFIEIAAGPLV
jgi:hypothetical protein